MTHAIGQIMIFLVYSFAMLGLLGLAFFVWRRANVSGLTQNKGNIKIESSFCITPRKTLLIINVEGERILIASDTDRTTFLTKLKNNDDNKQNCEQDINKNTLHDNSGVNILQELIKKRGM